MNFIRVTLSILLLFIVSKNFAQEKVIADTADMDTTIFKKVEIEAGFPGGTPAWQKFLERNLNGQVPSDKGASTGLYRVLVQFVVSKEGFVSEVKPLTSLGYGMEQEVVRAIKKSGVWIPAQQSGRFVKAYRTQPVVFMVSAENFTIYTDVNFVLHPDVDNEITVEAGRTKSEDLRLTISKGTVTPTGNGKFIAQVTGTGRVIIEVFKKNKSLGTASFEVKQ